MIEPDVEQDACVAAKRRREQRARGGDVRVRVGVRVDRAMQRDAGADLRRQRRIDAAAYEIADQAAEHQFGVGRSEQGVCEQVHRLRDGRFAGNAIIVRMKPRDGASAPPFPAQAATLLLPGAAGAIEVAVGVPADDARNGVAIICHPHPLQGGTMFNKVVTTLDRGLGELGLATVRFNFRGVGKSEGEHDEGSGEADDLVTVAEWVRRERPGAALWLAGFSFGSYVVLRAAAKLAPQQLILIAPPVGRWDFSGIEWPLCPVLIVQGGDDDIVDPVAVAEWAAQQEPPPAFVRMAEAGHFFHRRLLDLRGAVRNGVRDHLPPPIAPAT